MHNSNSELFWDMLKLLNYNNFENKNLSKTLPLAQSLAKYYKDLLQRSLTMSVQKIRHHNYSIAITITMKLRKQFSL